MLVSLHILNTPLLSQETSLWPALAPLPPSVHPPTLVNTTCSGFRWSWTHLWYSVYVLGKRHHLQSSHGTLDEPLGCVMFVYLACLPLHLLVCVCGLARFAGRDARLSWWICILAKRTDKGRDGGRTSGGVWMLDRGMLASVAPFGQINSKPLVSVISGSVREWWREVWIDGGREEDTESESENKLHLNW